MARRCLRVLLAENRLSEAGVTLRSLCAEAGWALEFIFVRGRGDLVHALSTHCPEVALVNLSLLQPGAAARVSVLHRTFPSIPLILFADPADKACAVYCLSRGATDFLLEGFMDERTMSRVLCSALAPSSVGVRLPSSPDHNSLSSMHFPKVRVTPPPPRPSVSSGHLGVLSISVENLEHVQFWMGTQAVDRMLQEITQVLKKCVRATDSVMPVCHGQLCIILDNVSECCYSVILQRIRARVKSHIPVFLLNPSPVFNVCEKSTNPASPPPLPSRPRAADSVAVSPAIG